MDCYNLFKYDESNTNNKNDDDDDDEYIVRIRLDTVFTQNILELLPYFASNPQCEILMDWDFFAIGKPKIMECYCTGLNNNYGNYNFTTVVPDKFPIMACYNTVDKFIWTYAPERQLFEMLFEYCNKNNLQINDAIKAIKCCSIVR